MSQKAWDHNMPPKNKCDDSCCEMRHPKRSKFFDMNNRCKFDNCAYEHTKDDNKVKIEMLET